MIALDQYIAETIHQISLGIQMASEECKSLGVIVNPNITVGSSTDSYVPSDSKHINVQRRVQNLEMEISISAFKDKNKNANVGIGVSVVGLGGKYENTEHTENTSKVKFSIPVCFPTTITD